MNTLDELERLAEKATKGPWVVLKNCITTEGDEIKNLFHEKLPVVCFGHDYECYGGMSNENRAYIAACSPERILALVAVARAAEEFVHIFDCWGMGPLDFAARYGDSIAPPTDEELVESRKKLDAALAKLKDKDSIEEVFGA